MTTSFLQRILPNSFDGFGFGLWKKSMISFQDRERKVKKSHEERERKRKSEEE